jgi:UPF0755 protein
MEELSLSNNTNSLNKSKKSLAYIFILIIFLSLVYFFFLSAPLSFPSGSVVEIKENSSLRSVSIYLEDNNIIRSRVLFETFMIILGGDRYIKPGDYLFEKKLPVFEIARRIAMGEKHLSPIKATIPEGFDVSEISNLFVSKLKNFDQNKFLQEASAKEGFLFPDTYFFFTNDNEQEVLRVMSENYEKKMIPVRPLIAKSGRTELDIITMASILEKEAEGNADRNIISGILWKRLSLGMPLQVDAAPITYKTKGLPQEPICNPGMDAIMAALNPQSSKYLYYLYDKDGNVHFAVTFAEHLLNKKKYLK